MFNLGVLNESLAAAFPKREAIVFRDRGIPWGRFAERTRRLANFLLARGLGCHRYELPKDVLFVTEMVRSPSGKADYRWAKRLAEERLVS
jgi:acyl-CoA synthetase (AMP-forming)/AMP-acid ligase II